MILSLIGAAVRVLLYALTDTSEADEEDKTGGHVSSCNNGMSLPSQQLLLHDCFPCSSSHSFQLTHVRSCVLDAHSLAITGEPE